MKIARVQYASRPQYACLADRMMWGPVRRYNSNKAHAGEMDDMLAAMEDTLYQHGVDVVFAGHVHAYERSFRTFR